MQAAHIITFLESPLLTAGVCLGAVLLGMFVGTIVYSVSWNLTHDGAGSSLIPRCHNCGNSLPFGASLPVLGWVLSRGSCPHCGESLGIERPSCELLCGGIFVGIVMRYGVAPQTFEMLAIVSLLMVMSITSLTTYRVPNCCIWAAVAVRVGYLGFLAVSGQDVSSLAKISIAGACALGIPLAIAVWLSNAMLAREVVGMGTVKMVAVVGMYLGWQQGMISLACAMALGALVWVVSPRKLLDVEVAGGPHRDSQGSAAIEDMPSPRELRATLEEDIAEPMRMIPFAPSIAIACWGILLLGVAPAAWNAPII